jgi:hypothetical protein
MSDLSSLSTLVEMGNQLNLLNKEVLTSNQTLQEQDITMLSSSYLFLTKGLSADNLKKSYEQKHSYFARHYDVFL